MRQLFALPEYPKVKFKQPLFFTPWHKIYKSATLWVDWMSGRVFDSDRLQSHSASRTDKIGFSDSVECARQPGWTNRSCVSTHSGQPCSCRARDNRVAHPKQSGLVLCQQRVGHWHFRWDIQYVNLQHSSSQIFMIGFIYIYIYTYTCVGGTNSEGSRKMCL